MTDWNLIIQGNISLLWIQECLDKKNTDKKIGKLLNEFYDKNEKISVLNPGTLFMATYLLFLYPKESEITNFDNIDLTEFNINTKGLKQNNETDKSYLLRRIRNSIAHGNFKIENNQIIFNDNNKSGSNPFKASIQISKFGSFINEFMIKAKENHFNLK
jgi:HEPN family protein